MWSFVCLSCLLPELGLVKCQNGSFLVVFADDHKKSVTAWTKYLIRSNLALLEYAMNYEF